MKKLIFLAIGMFTVGCSSFIIAGLLPQIGQTISQPIAVTGQGITAFNFAYLISALLFSVVFANKSAKQMIQFSLVIFLLGNVITLFSQSLVPFLIGRTLAGMGVGVFSPLCITIAIHATPSSAKGRVLSLLWGANTAGVVFGVPLGLHISSAFNWQASILYLVVLGLLTMIGFSVQKANAQLPQAPPLKERFRLLIDRKILLVISVTCFIALASLGLYSYIAPLQQGSAHSLTQILLAWGLGGFVGSSSVGTFIDRTQKPQVIMAYIIIGLMLAFIAIPFLKNLPYLGLIPFFLWGAFGWSIKSPQQHILFSLQEKQGTILVALNASAIGLGGALGTAMGGLMITNGIPEFNLPFFSAFLLFGVLILQLFLISNLKRSFAHA